MAKTTDKNAKMNFSEIRNCQKERFAVRGTRGLYVCKKSDTHYFYFRYTDVNNKRRELPLLNFSQDTTLNKGTSLLKQAISLADDYRKMRSIGNDPIEYVREQRHENAQKTLKKINPPAITTFKECAERWIEGRVSNNYWINNSKGEAEARSKLKNHIYPYLENKDIKKINAQDVLECLAPIWQPHPSVADKARTIIKKVLDWAVANEKRPSIDNPALLSGPLGVLLEDYKNGRIAEKHYASCPVVKIPELIKALHQNGSMSAKMFEFQILTATRQQAVRMMKWDGEFDLDRAIWEIPRVNDKAKAEGRERTIYLSS